MSLESWLNNWRLRMAPEKCVYSIFFNNRKAGDKGKRGFNNEFINLKLYKHTIKQDNNVTFPALRFDKYLTFKFYLTNNGKSTKTHCYYKTMVRSLFDYSLFIYPLLSNKNKRSLRNIHDCALRIIYKKRYDFDMESLHTTSELETLDTRSKRLLSNYFKSAENNTNPICEDLLVEFEKFQKNFKN